MTRKKRPASIRLLLVDDHPLMLEGLRRYLRGRRTIEVVGLAGNGAEALRLAKQTSPDVVLMDIEMPKMDGIEATRRLRDECPDARVIVLTGQGTSHVETVRRAGAWGYLVKDARPGDVARAVLDVASGASTFGDLRKRDSKEGDDEPASEKLTPREREVLLLIVRGLSNKEIAESLGIGVRTVETHRENLSRKIGVRGAAALTKWAIANGVARVDD